MPESPLFGKRVVMVGPVVIVDVTIESELRRVGARTVAACQTIAECIDACERERPDLLLMGISPHSLDESVDAVRKIGVEQVGFIAAIVLNLDMEAEWQLRDAGVMAIFKKPFTALDLIPVLEENYRQRHPGGKSA